MRKTTTQTGGRFCIKKTAWLVVMIMLYCTSDDCSMRGTNTNSLDILWETGQ